MATAICISTHYPVTSRFFTELHLNDYNTVNAGLFVCLFWINLQTKGRRQWHPIQYSCLENPMDGGRSLVGCGPWGREESDTTERLHFPFSLSCTAEGNGNPLQYSCLENSRDGGAWWLPSWGRTESDTTEAPQQQQQQCWLSVWPFSILFPF